VDFGIDGVWVCSIARRPEQNLELGWQIEMDGITLLWAIDKIDAMGRVWAGRSLK
jgi:hypothetical protein